MASELEVGKVKVIGSGSTGATLRLENTTTSTAADDIAGTVNFYTNDASDPSGGRVCGYVRSVADDQYNRYGLRFGTANHNETIQERMSISATGLASFLNGVTVDGENNWGHISGKNSTSLSLADDAQVQLADTEAGAMMIHIYDRGSGAGAVIFATYFGQPELVAGSTNYFDVADTDGKYCVIKSSSSHDVYFKNRSGTTRNFRILVTAGVIDNF